MWAKCSTGANGARWLTDWQRATQWGIACAAIDKAQWAEWAVIVRTMQGKLISLVLLIMCRRHFVNHGNPQPKAEYAFPKPRSRSPPLSLPLALPSLYLSLCSAKPLFSCSVKLYPSSCPDKSANEPVSHKGERFTQLQHAWRLFNASHPPVERFQEELCARLSCLY